MTRGAVLTLGAIASLAGLSAARAGDATLFGWPSLSPIAPAVTEVLPSLPQNWHDLPLQLHVSESIGYNSNFLNVPTGPGAAAAAYGRPVGTMQSISTYGATFQNEISGQKLFADVNWGMYRYLNNGHYNTGHSSADLGDNFTLGSKCTGSLKLSESSAPSTPGQQVGVNVINNLTTLSATENASCIVNGEYSALFNSGYTKSTNSALPDKPNDYQSIFAAAGISYAVSETNSLQVLATLTGTKYTSRQPVFNSQGLVDNITTEQVMATYTKSFSPNLSVNAQVGVLGYNDTYLGVNFPKTLLPQYSLSVQWSVTPKLSVSASASRLASAPSAVVSNLQITESATGSFAYRLTPKIGVGGNLFATYSTGAATPFLYNSPLAPYASSQRTYGGGTNVSYAVSPFLSANLSYQYTRSVQSTLTWNTSLILLALNFNPY